jgi:hypothetical protein
MIEIERDRWGRPLIPNVEGTRSYGYARATTISEVQGDRHNLEKWMQRQVLKGIAIDESLMTFVKAAGDDKKLLNQLVEDAHAAAKSGQAAEDGTKLHDILHAVGLGQDVEIPPRWARHVKEWQRVTADWTFLCREQMVISDTHEIAGTPDAIAIVPAVGPMPIIVDWKTGSSIDFGFREMAAQLAIYAHAEFLYEHDDGLGRRPMPEVSLTHGLIVHLPENGGGSIRMHKIDLVEGWKAAKRSMEVRGWRRKKMADLTEILPDGDPVEQWLRRRIMRLAAIPEAVPYLVEEMKPQYGSLNTSLDLTYEEEITSALTKLEDAFQTPFPERHPTKPTTGRKKNNK